MDKMSVPLVSISCITYNHAPYIRQCLDGFMMQKTNFTFEVLIHDDCSTDGTTEIIKEYERKYPNIIKPIYEEENQYQNGRPRGSAVWNFPRAKGKYIALCEGDDYWTDPLKLQKQVDFLESHLDYSIVYGKVRRFIQRTGKLGSTFGSGVHSMKELIQENVIPTPTVLLRREIVDTYIRDVHPSEKNWLMGDFPMWLYAASKGEMHFIDDILAIYRVLQSSASHSNQIESKINFENSYFDIQNWFNNKYKLINPSLIENYHNIRLFETALMFNQREMALASYKKIANPDVKIKVKAAIARLNIISIFKYISYFKGYK